jgi:hypothetical protein
VPRVFVSYKRNIEPDERLAGYFADYLMQRGHEVFIDQQIRVGQEWPTVIRQELEQSNFLVVLLSERAIASEMILEEVRIAHEFERRRGTPIILPVRVAYTGSLPYDLGAMLNRIQYVVWERDGDEINISEQLAQAIDQNLALPGQPPQAVGAVVELAADGNELSPNVQIAAPLPAFDPQWLEQLTAPGGAVRLRSPFYMARQVDNQARGLILREGVTLRIKGCRQMGKSSLLARLYQHALDNNRQALYVDFQRLDGSHFQDINSLLVYLAILVARRFRTITEPREYWQTEFGPKDKLTFFLEEQVLVHAERPVVLLMDEVDRVFAEEAYRDDFFSLIRAWHNNRAFDPTWERLNLVLAYSTEAFMFIRDLNQSPFNVGDAYELVDFDRSQVEELDHRHGSPIGNGQAMDRFVTLFSGHPYLVRRALYELVDQGLTPDQLMERACNDDGPFSDHLHRYLWHFHENPGLRAAMRSAIREGVCPTDRLFYQLRSAGLVRGSHRNYVQSRCGLYEEYFGRHL